MPPPETPVTAVKAAERDRGGDVLQIVAGRAGDGELSRLGDLRGACSGISISSAPERYFPVSERGLLHDVLRRALRDDLAAVDAGGRADVDHVVGGEDRLLVVLDHDHRVAEVAEVFQRLEQALRCRAGAGRSRARRARRARRSGPSRSARRGGCAGSRRRRACRNCATASGSRARRRSGNPGARGSPSGCGRRSRSAAC